MILKDFIKSVLVDIDAGIIEAANQTHKNIRLMTFSGQDRGIDFDVAVTTSSEATGKAGAEISVVSIGSIGAKADAKIASEEVSRVKFTIVASFDTQAPAQHELGIMETRAVDFHNAIEDPDYE
jgi:hypothetical protein